jgi:hypothetical protein
MTFKLIFREGNRMILKDLFPSTKPSHKKGNALYTINALNKLIDQTMSTSVGNTDYKSFKINWDEYQNKIILINNKELGIFSIERVF